MPDPGRDHCHDDGMTDPTSRALRLLSLMQSRRDWAGTDLSVRLGVSLRTLRRDVERLRELGYPVEASRGVAGGYRLVAGTAMPPLVLEDDEAVAKILRGEKVAHEREKGGGTSLRASIIAGPGAAEIRAKIAA